MVNENRSVLLAVEVMVGATPPAQYNVAPWNAKVTDLPPVPSWVSLTKNVVDVVVGTFVIINDVIDWFKVILNVCAVDKSKVNTFEEIDGVEIASV